MSAACAQIAGEIVDAVEYGAPPWPVFFADTQCGSGQFPPQGESLPAVFVNTTFSLRSQACLFAPGVPNPVSTADSGFQGDNAFLDPKLCPLPAIQSGLIPPGFKITFYAANPPPGNLIVDPGVYVMTTGGNTQDPMVDSTGIFVLRESSDSLRWGSSRNGNPGSPDCSLGDRNYVNDPSSPPFFWTPTREQVFDADGYVLQSLYSCGMPFWPSLSSVTRQDDVRGAPKLRANGMLAMHDQNYGQNGEGAGPDYCISTKFFRYGATTGGNLGYAIAGPLSGVNNCTNGGPTYTTADCVASATDAYFGSTDPTTGIRFFPCYAPSGDADNFRRCGCPSTMQMNGSMDNIRVEFNGDGGWERQQFEYCIGQQRLTIGGIHIQRYGNSTLACDPIVESFCQNTALIASNPQYTKACACIQEQAKFNAQFSGLNLPVQCFTDICSDNDPNVYRTVEQAKGCSARLCTQIIEINGSAISSEGFQTMLCDGQKYVVATTNTSPAPVPTISVQPVSNITLGPVFFISLGLLGLMVVLLAAWGIRKWIITKRQQKLQKQQVTRALEQLIQK